MGAFMTLKKKRLILITVLIIIAAVTIVLCVNYFTKSQVYEFDGTLVDTNFTFHNYL
jgi:flagellar basal body-associated protein FliL